MLTWTLVLVPLAAGAATAAAGPWVDADRRRRVVGAGAVGALAATLAVSVPVALSGPTVAVDLGPGWRLTAAVTPLAGVLAVLVPAVALPVVAYATGHEETAGLGRLAGGLVGFVGAMELVVVAGDLLTLLIGWELMGAFSYGLIAHEWREESVPARAAHAFNATRLGDLGLFAAAGAAFAGVGALDYASLQALSGWPLHVLVAGVVLAAAAKSAQGPFAPWLFSAMAGPTPVSALLHSATMVAAGAYLLARLQPVLAPAGWFAPTVVGLGLATALGGGVVAALQPHAKKLLAASTSAQYGMMFVAVGAGFPAAAGAHLVTHAVLKSLLFLTAGIGIAATGSALLGRQRLGSQLPRVAAASGVGALALAAVPPLGAAWTKEELVAAAGHATPVLALALAVAGGLSALYASRFHLMAYGSTGEGPRLIEGPGPAERAAVWALAAASVAAGLLFLPGSKHVAATLLGGELPSGAPWELVVSLSLVAAGIWTGVVATRRGGLGSLGLTGRPAAAADWLGLPTAIRRLGVAPALSLAAGAARFDDRIVDAGVRGAAAVGTRLSALLAGPARPAGPPGGQARGVDWGVDRVVSVVAGAAQRLAAVTAGLAEQVVDGFVEATAAGVGAAGRDSRRLQSGLVHHYYVLIVLGLVGIAVVAAVWR